ncbi:MAG TPA: hypothetical protein VK198_09960, partial [Terriglobales bacterium]|nr:hypothetical protein [Terriglobales bacterium]
SAANNSLVPITWTLEDDFYATPADGWAKAASGNPVVRPPANTLVAIGPVSKSCKTQGRITLLLNGVVQGGAGTFTNDTNTNHYTFTWNTKGFCSGSYTFELNLDSGKQFQTTTTPLVLK